MLSGIKNMEIIIKKIWHNHFFKYITTSVIITFISTFLLWFFVDILHLLASVMGFIIALVVFFSKFFLYQRVNLFNKNKGIFMKYSFIWLFVTLLASFLLWIFVDIIKLRVVIVNPIVLVLTFILRFYLFKVFNILTKLDSIK